MESAAEMEQKKSSTTAARKTLTGGRLSLFVLVFELEMAFIKGSFAYRFTRLY